MKLLSLSEVVLNDPLYHKKSNNDRLNFIIKYTIFLNLKLKKEMFILPPSSNNKRVILFDNITVKESDNASLGIYQNGEFKNIYMEDIGNMKVKDLVKYSFNICDVNFMAYIDNIDI